MRKRVNKVKARIKKQKKSQSDNSVWKKSSSKYFWYALVTIARNTNLDTSCILRDFFYSNNDPINFLLFDKFDSTNRCQLYFVRRIFVKLSNKLNKNVKTDFDNESVVQMLSDFSKEGDGRFSIDSWIWWFFFPFFRVSSDLEARDARRRLRVDPAKRHDRASGENAGQFLLFRGMHIFAARPNLERLDYRQQSWLCLRKRNHFVRSGEYFSSFRSLVFSFFHGIVILNSSQSIIFL